MATSVTPPRRTQRPTAHCRESACATLDRPHTVARDAVRLLYAVLCLTPSEAIDRWRFLFGKWAGGPAQRVPKHFVALAKRYDIPLDDRHADILLFALQTYYALLVTLVAARLVGDQADDLLPGNPFSWHTSDPSEAVHRLVSQVTDALDLAAMP